MALPSRLLMAVVLLLYYSCPYHSRSTAVAFPNLSNCCCIYQYSPLLLSKRTVVLLQYSSSSNCTVRIELVALNTLLYQ